ncbi:TPA: thioredoxin family protein [Klebsiella michiganensis]
MFAGKKSAQIREILISESAWEEMTCLFAPSFADRLDGDIQVGKVNVDQAPVLTTKYEIWGLPSVLIFHEGQLVKRIPGVKPASVYAQAIADIKKGQ